MLLFAFCFVPTTFATPDVIHLRDGQILEGKVITEQRGAYLVQPADNTMAGQLQIPKEAVKYVLYADSEAADRYLGISAARRKCQDQEMRPVTILPTRAFGEAAVEAVKAASESIWIMAYLVSGSQTSPIKDFYEIIREKARSGVDVVMICEYSTATTPGVRHRTMNFVQELSQDRVTVRFVQEFKSMHKKMIIVDEETVLLGSSNLTLAGTSHSNEMNVRIDSRPFVRAAVEDFRRMQARAVPASEVK